ncbi:sugar ABC transporter ATP-binding protein [Streptomyces sp. NPDC090088]|uniref:sugar ABC transporter ATP-binding protein n=1 Tax=Streptomyces sp. NPDC090088 TaxID=3365944 RepID=UPI00382AA469
MSELSPVGGASRPEPAFGGLVVEDLSKTFTGTKALDGVTAHFPAGRITALLGQNGSGKSTLIKILAGFYHPDAGGRITVADREVPTPVAPRRAHDAGLRFIHQDLGLVESLTVEDNFSFVNGFGTGLVGPIRHKDLRRRVQRSLDDFGVEVSPRALVATLSPTQRTMVAIARAFADDGSGGPIADRVLILDEPTASLPAGEVHTVFRALRQARDAGATVVFVSHRIDEVRELADRLVVLRDGKLTADRDLGGLGVRDIVNLILGREFTRVRAERREVSGDIVLQCLGLRGRRLQGIDLSVRKGEIVGVTGLLGCGRSELTRLVTGAQTVSSGKVLLNGAAMSFRSPKDAIKAGVASVPQNRRADGCIPAMNLRQNITLSDLGPFWRGGRLRQKEERTAARSAVESFGIRPGVTEKPLSKFSGGNQQKAVVAKWTRIAPRVLVLDEPTQGVDIGAKQEIAQIVTRLADDGVAVLVASSDFEELVNLCDRVLVLNRGRLVADVPREELTESHLTVLSTGEGTER